MLLFFFLYLLRREASHCWIVVLLKSDEWRAKAEPCQQALVKGHNRNRCVVDSSSALLEGHKLWVVIPLLFRLKKGGQSVMHEFPHQGINFQRYFNTPNQFPHPFLWLSLPLCSRAVLYQNLICRFDLVLSVIWIFPEEFVLNWLVTSTTFIMYQPYYATWLWKKVDFKCCSGFFLVMLSTLKKFRLNC